MKQCLPRPTQAAPTRLPLIPGPGRDRRWPSPLPAAYMAHDDRTSSDPQTIHVRHSPMVPIDGPTLVSRMGKRARWTSSSTTHTTTSQTFTEKSSPSRPILSPMHPPLFETVGLLKEMGIALGRQCHPTSGP